MSKRQVVLDTETTGLEVKNGNRIIEIGAVEMIDGQLTGKTFHTYINPERKIEEGALAIHGISSEFLLDKPKFKEIAQDFIDFIKDAELLIHNADFDKGFLDSELGLEGYLPLKEYCSGITCTLIAAQSLYPGKVNNLNALCKRYKIDIAHRDLHGGLLDARLLAEVVLSMPPEAFSIIDDAEIGRAERPPIKKITTRGSSTPTVKLTESDISTHENYIKEMEVATKAESVWNSPSSKAAPKM